MNDPIQLVTTKPDTELAEELKAELAKAAEPWLVASTKAKNLGFDVQAQFGMNAFKQVVIIQLNLIRVF